MSDLIEGIFELQKELEVIQEEMKRTMALYHAHVKADHGEWGAALEAVSPWAQDPTSDEAAVGALAATRLAFDGQSKATVLGEAKARLKRAEALARRDNPKWGFTYEYLAAASAALGDVEGAAKHWREYLESQDPVIAAATALLAEDKLGSMARDPAITSVNKEFMTRNPSPKVDGDD